MTATPAARPEFPDTESCEADDVINASQGIAVNTRRMFREAGARGLGRMIVLNKLDADKLLDSIKRGTAEANKERVRAKRAQSCRRIHQSLSQRGQHGRRSSQSEPGRQ